MLHSFAELQDRNYDCAFFVIGGGNAEDRLRRRAAELGVHQDVTFVEGLGSIALSEVFRAGDLFISPHATGDFDVPALLAMAAGVPVLATPQRGCDFLIDGQTATLFPPGNASELTMKLIALLDDRAGARGLAESALNYLRKHHSAAKMVSIVAEAYRDAVG
jgi:phosphatidylinositol alpha-1,6-mannosyltransferase